MAELIGREVKIGDKEGEITNVLGIGYEITFFDINLGKTFIDSRDIYDYLIQQENHVSFEKVIDWIHRVKLVNVTPVR